MSTQAKVVVVCLGVLALLWLHGEMLPSSPVPGVGFHLAIIEDRASRGELSAEQIDAIFSVEIDRLLQRNTPSWKYIMDIKDDMSSESDEWARKAFALPRKPLPMYVIDHNGRGEVGTVTTLSELKKSVGKYLK